MTHGLTREITQAEIDEYRDLGVVRLEGVLSQDWINLLAEALEEVFYENREAVPVFYDSTETAEQL